MRPGFGLYKPFDGQAARGGNGAMTGFKTDTPDQVKAAYAAARPTADAGSSGRRSFRPPESTTGCSREAYGRATAAGNKLCVYATVA